VLSLFLALVISVRPAFAGGCLPPQLCEMGLKGVVCDELDDSDAFNVACRADGMVSGHYTAEANSKEVEVVIRQIYGLDPAPVATPSPVLSSPTINTVEEKSCFFDSIINWIKKIW